MRGYKHFPSKEAILLYFVFTVPFMLIFGVLFSEMGLYPSIIKNIGIDIVVLIGPLVFRFVRRLYRRVHAGGRIAWASVITAVLVAMLLYNIAQAAKIKAVATANVSATEVAQENAVATATEQANVGATALAVATSVAQANATARAIASYYPFSRTLLLRDLLEGTRSPNFWDTTSHVNKGCQYQGFAYRVSTSERVPSQICFAEGTEYFTNFTYEIQMRIAQGDCGGIAFRASDANSDFYVFKICQEDRSFEFGMYANGVYKEISSGNSVNILKGLTEINTIAVVAQRCSFQFYINNPVHPAFKASECTYGEGHIGVFIYLKDSGQSTRVFFSHAKVWKL